MNDLKTVILDTILRHGPQTHFALWHNAPFQTLTAVVVAIGELEEAELIQRVPNNKQLYFHLTEKGRHSIAAKQQQEVPIGSL